MYRYFIVATTILASQTRTHQIIYKLGNGDSRYRKGYHEGFVP